MAKAEASFKKRTYATALDFLKKKFGKDVLLSKDTELKIARQPTGLYSFDEALGGGIPLGRIMELFGMEGSGKTTLALQIAKQFQSRKERNLVLYIDFENALDLTYAEMLGVSLDEKLWSLAQPASLEEGVDILGILAYTGTLGIVLVDSVAAMTPEAELEGSMSDNSIGLQARKMGQALRKLVKILNVTQTPCIFINQVREKIGGFGNPFVTPGGNALKFYSSIRIGLTAKKSPWFTEEGGKLTTMRIYKNKTTLSQGLKVQYELIPGKGLSAPFEVFQKALDCKIIIEKGRKYILNDKSLTSNEILVALEKDSFREKLWKLCEKRGKTKSSKD